MLKKLDKEEITNEISDTKLGDWYVDYLYTRPFHIAIFVSEKTLLPILVSTSPIESIFIRFQDQIRAFLREIKIPEKAINEEVRKMIENKITKTKNKRILGTMNDQKYHLRFNEIDHFPKSLIRANYELAEMPVGAIQMKIPIEEVQELLN
jgi:hypothetical protein